MVLVHGTPWSSLNLRHLIAGLSADYSVYFYDLLGYGQSCMAEGSVSLGCLIIFTKLSFRTMCKSSLQAPDETVLKQIVLFWTGGQAKAAFYCHMAQADPCYTDEVQLLYLTLATPTLVLWGRLASALRALHCETCKSLPNQCDAYHTRGF